MFGSGTNYVYEYIGNFELDIEKDDNAPVSKEEAARIIVLRLGKGYVSLAETDIFKAPFTDVTENMGYIAILKGKSIINGEPDGSFNEEYCKWCYTDGKFIYHSLDELVDFLVDHVRHGISSREEARAEEHLDGDFAFVIETDGYTSFSEDWNRPLIKQNTNSDYRFGKATHGHHPDRGPQPVFLGFGPDIREGVRIGRRSTVDEAPTYAKILGLDYPHADGRAMDEILK